MLDAVRRCSTNGPTNPSQSNPSIVLFSFIYSWYCRLHTFFFLNGLWLIPLLCANQPELQCPLATAELGKNFCYFCYKSFHFTFLSPSKQGSCSVYLDETRLAFLEFKFGFDVPNTRLYVNVQLLFTLFICKLLTGHCQSPKFKMFFELVSQRAALAKKE